VTIASPVTDRAPVQIVRSYLVAFVQEDLARCVSFYADDGWIQFPSGKFVGPIDVEHWHRQRFAARMRLLKVRSIDAQGELVTVKADVTSQVLLGMKIQRLPIRVTLRLENGLIKEVRFSLAP
jgi:limonene-1,2-epoxide hydrolase